MTTGVFRCLDEVLAGIPRTGVVHVGAHRGQEVADYRRVGFDRIVLVEPNPALRQLLDHLDVAEVHCCAAGTGPSPASLYVTEWDERSSLHPPLHYPVVSEVPVDVRPLSELQAGCNVAVIDVQGSEHDVIRSAELDRLDVVIVETSEHVRYRGEEPAEAAAAHMVAAGWYHCGDFAEGHSPGVADAVWRHPSCV